LRRGGCAPGLRVCLLIACWATAGVVPNSASNTITKRFWIFMIFTLASFLAKIYALNVGYRHKWRSSHQPHLEKSICLACFMLGTNVRHDEAEFPQFAGSLDTFSTWCNHRRHMGQDAKHSM